MNLINKITFAIFVFIFPVISLAGDGDGNLSTNNSLIHNPIGSKTLSELIRTILEGAIKIGIPIIALAIIYSGFLFVSARGNTESIKKAKDSLLYTIIGAAILLGSYAIAQLITDTVKAL